MFYCYMDQGRHFRLNVILVHSSHFIPEVPSINDWSTVRDPISAAAIPTLSNLKLIFFYNSVKDKNEEMVGI